MVEIARCGRRGSSMSHCQDEPELAQSQPRTRNPTGRPRGDARVLAVLGTDTWAKGSEVAERLGLSPGAAYAALWRAQRRGLIEHRPRYGYRLKEAQS